MIAYLNQRGMLDYDKAMICRCGTTMRLRPNKRLTDGWWWKCPVRECQKSKSVRTGTFFF